MELILRARFGITTLTLLLVLALHASLAKSQADEFLQDHNQARSAVGVPPLTWDSNLAAYAQNYFAPSDHCQLTHSGGPYGENLFLGSAGASWSPTDAVNDWVSESQYYHYDSNTCDPGQVCGHYTQVVWRDSQNLGCASLTCSDGSTLIACEYNPPGNIVGQRPY